MRVSTSCARPPCGSDASFLSPALASLNRSFKRRSPHPIPNKLFATSGQTKCLKEDLPKGCIHCRNGGGHADVPLPLNRFQDLVLKQVHQQDTETSRQLNK